MSILLDRLEAMLRSQAYFMEALYAVREVGLPEGYIGGGVIRTLVWDTLHLFDEPTPFRDIDVAFFDPDDFSEAREKRVEAALRELCPSLPWEARNQAAVHTWYARKFGYSVTPLSSCAEGVATWPETATAIAVRLESDDRLTVLAPCGLDDLFNLILRRNPRRVTHDLFMKRLKEKRILELWPRVQVAL